MRSHETISILARRCKHLGYIWNHLNSTAQKNKENHGKVKDKSIKKSEEVIRRQIETTRGKANQL
jgi:hypothetical protein